MRGCLPKKPTSTGVARLSSPGYRAPVEQQDVDAALEAAIHSDGDAMEHVGPVLEAYSARIKRMLSLRMDQRVSGRVGVSDVMQDAYIEVVRRLPAYLAEDDEPKEGKGGRMPFFLWVRFLAGQALQQTHRQHLGTVGRDAGRDVPMHASGAPEASSLMLANALVDSGISPSGIAVQEEQRSALNDALSSLGADDREILFMRHFEQLSNHEIAELLRLTPGGASLRHLKALGRLQRALAQLGIKYDPPV